MLTRKRARLEGIIVTMNLLPNTRKSRRRTLKNNIKTEIKELSFTINNSKQVCMSFEEFCNKWAVFLSNEYNNEPTDAQYQLAYTIWNHILKTANGGVLINNANKILLYRDFRGGTLSNKIRNLLKDPYDVVLQSTGEINEEIPLNTFLKKDMKLALTNLKKIGWYDETNDSNNYSNL